MSDAFSPVTRMFALGLAIVSLAGGTTLHAQKSADPFTGTWILNRALSKFVPGPPPKQRTVTFVLTDDSFKESIETTRAFVSESLAGGLGGTETTEFTAKFDGRDYPITNSGLSFVSIKRVNPRTVLRTGKVGVNVVETSERTISADGKRLTITTEGHVDGNTYSSVQIFDRQKP